MRRVITVVLLIACTCIVISSQQPDNKVSDVKRPPAGRLPLTPPDFVFGQLQVKTQTLLPVGQATKSSTIGNRFVLLNGGAYMIINGKYFTPMPGGGASGCFSLDLPQRIANLQEFVPRLAAPNPGVLKQN